MPSLRGVALAALVPIGTLIGHTAGYGAAGEHVTANGAHAYFGPATWLAAAAAAGALGWFAIGARRASPLPRLRRLAAAQVFLFFAMEAVEHLLSGHGVHGLLAEPSLRWGAAAQVVVAGGLALTAMVARAAGVRVRALLTSRPFVVIARPAVLAPVVVHRGFSAVPASPARPRGPPPTLVPA